MKKRNPIEIVLLIILGLFVSVLGILYFGKFRIKQTNVWKNQPIVIITKKELPRVYELMEEGGAKTKIEKAKVNLLKKKLYNACLNREGEVRKFLLENNDPKILEEMAKIPMLKKYTLSSKSKTGEKVKITQSLKPIFECFNLSKDKFKECQEKENGLLINEKTAENNVLKANSLMSYLGEGIIGRYLECKAIETGDDSYCPKIGLYKKFFADEGKRLGLKEGFIYDCKKYAQMSKFILATQTKKDYNCQDLCKNETDFGSFKNCYIFCQGIKNKDISKLKEIKMPSFERNFAIPVAKSIINLDSSYCQEIKPDIVYDLSFENKGLKRVASDKYWNECQGKIEGINRKDSYRWKHCLNSDKIGGIVGIEKISQKEACIEETNLYKGVRDKNYSLLKSIAKNGYNVEELAGYLDEVLEKKGNCENLFHEKYLNYCKSKYGE